jgi:hypothetical protein
MCQAGELARDLESEGRSWPVRYPGRAHKGLLDLSLLLLIAVGSDGSGRPGCVAGLNERRQAPRRIVRGTPATAAAGWSDEFSWRDGA